MRIGLIIYGSLETMTGGYLYDRIVVQGLKRLGHEVEVISLAGGSYLRKLGQGLSPGLWRRLLAAGFDLLLQDELCHPSLFLAEQTIAPTGGPPVVAIVHHICCREPRPCWQNWLLSLAERRYLASVDGFIFNSKTTGKTVTALVGDHQTPGDRLPGRRPFRQPPFASTHQPASLPARPIGIALSGHSHPQKRSAALAQCPVRSGPRPLAPDRGGWTRF